MNIYGDDDLIDWLDDDGRRELYEQEGKEHLLYLLGHYVEAREPVPTWLQDAFFEALRAGAACEIKSWDEVFGSPLPKRDKGHVRQETEHRNRAIRFQLVDRGLRRQRAGEAIDFYDIGQNLVGTDGKKYSINASTARTLYYETLKEYEDWVEGYFLED